MAAAAILKIAFLAITHRPIVRFQRNFVRGSRTACRQGPDDKNCNFFLNPRWRTAAILKIAISQWKIVRFLWNLVHYIRYWTRLQSRDQNKNCNFWNSRWRRPPSGNSLFLAITHRPIVRFRPNVVCGSRTACRQGHMIKTASFQNPRWRTAAILKIVKLPYPSENIVGFWQNLVYYSMYWTWWGFQKRYRRILDVIR